MTGAKHWDMLLTDIMGSRFAILGHFQNLTGEHPEQLDATFQVAVLSAGLQTRDFQTSLPTQQVP